MSPMRTPTDVLLLIVEASSDWEDWDVVEVDKAGKVKVIPKGRQSKKASSASIISDPHGEF